MRGRKKELWTIVKQELQEGENIWINKISQETTDEWWKFEEFTFDQLFNNYSGKEKVLKYWHEDGLCIVLDM